MEIVTGKITTNVGKQQQQDIQEAPPVPGAVRLSPMEMNMLHFGSPRNSPLPKRQSGNSGTP